eukprot:CAMPEP_0184297236 /NCGR_PEP_ID=MMETSP1049-20130417/8166_1 /TAXON_ID=77928 /ORGANISM="Proteomonas sulcata, Strain CCMP704" /LENGTH=477 /DNA_ID=CAMNT_0026606871 /DNA_START=30 /DNA_END=1464 /DNA_ORIENTATION=+
MEEMREMRAKFRTALDPLLEQLSTFDTTQDLTERIKVVYSILDADHGGTLDFTELNEGLRRLKFEPPIALSPEDYDLVTEDRALCNENSELIHSNFERMMRQQLTLYAQHQCANAMVQTDDRFSKRLMFVLKMMNLNMADHHAWCRERFGGVEDRRATLAKPQTMEGNRRGDLKADSRSPSREALGQNVSDSLRNFGNDPKDVSACEGHKCCQQSETMMNQLRKEVLQHIDNKFDAWRNEFKDDLLAAVRGEVTRGQSQTYGAAKTWEGTGSASVKASKVYLPQDNAASLGKELTASPTQVRLETNGLGTLQPTITSPTAGKEIPKPLREVRDRNSVAIGVEGSATQINVPAMEGTQLSNANGHGRTSESQSLLLSATLTPQPHPGYGGVRRSEGFGAEEASASGAESQVSIHSYSPSEPLSPSMKETLRNLRGEALCLGAGASPMGPTRVNQGTEAKGVRSGDPAGDELSRDFNKV